MILCFLVNSPFIIFMLPKSELIAVPYRTIISGHFNKILEKLEDGLFWTFAPTSNGFIIYYDIGVKKWNSSYK